MKKQNALSASIFAILFLSFSLLTISCESEESSSTKRDFFYEAESKSSFNLTDQIQLNQLAKVLTKETTEIKIVKDASVVSLSDSQGEFKAISFTYQLGDFITKMTVPISEVSSDKIGMETSKGKDGIITYYYMPAGCEMKCTTSWPCSSCTQEIIERCKSQTCTCNNGSSGCTSSIVFPE